MATKKEKAKRIIKQVGIGQAWLDLLLFKRPDLDGHGAAWAIESAIADLIGVHRPKTPQQARESGAKLRGKQLKNKPALNPAGRKPKEEDANPDALTPPASRARGSGAGGRQKAALARLHSAGVAKSRRTASLPRAGGRRLPLWGGTPSRSFLW